MTNQTVLEWCSKLEPDLGFQSYLLLRQQDRVDEDSQYVTFFPEVEEQVYVCVWSKGSDEITLFLTGDILKNGEE